MSTFVIGDIHGGFRALEQLFEKAKFTRKDRLIFLGDYVDGWSEAVEVIDFLIELEQDYNCIFIRGNHDDLAYQWIKGKQMNPTWLKHGGEATRKSYQRAGGEKIEEHRAFFERLHNYFINENNQLFVHAGFTNLHGPALEYYEHSFYWDRTLWEMALALNPDLEPNDPRYPERLTHFREIFIGHTPVTRIGKTKPLRAANVWNADTGAAFKGPLTAMEMTSKKIIQTQPVNQLYPGEAGRN